MNKISNPTMIYFVEKECTPSWKISNNELTFYDLLFILSGSADYIIDDVPYHVEKGDILFISCGSTRTASTTGMKCVSIDFLLNEGDEISIPTVSNVADFDEFYHLFRELKYEWLQKSEGYQLKCQAVFALILHKLLYGQKDEKGNRHVRTIKRYIIEHYMEEITVSGLADMLNINPVYCGALFKKSEGISIHEFIINVRINKAASLLQTGEYNVGEVADLTGFKDVYYFSSTFKRIMHVPPSGFRGLETVYPD